MQSKGVKLNIRNIASKGKRVKGKKNKRIPYSKIGAQVWSDIGALRSMLNTELKYLDIVNSGTNGTTFTINLLNGCVQGLTAITREGDTVRAKRLQLNITFKVNASSTLGATNFRMWIIRDLECNGGTFSVASYLAQTTNVMSVIFSPQCARFVTLDDQIFVLDNAGPQGITYRKVYELDFHVEMGLANAGTIADIAKNALFLCLLSDDNTNMPSFSFVTRYQFIDN